MSSQNVEHIKQRLDLVDLVQSYVKLEKSGINYRGRCPFHQERTPSFFVSPARQTWRCFGCQKGGDHFTFVEEIEGVDFPEALKILAARAGIELVRENPAVISERARLLSIAEETAKFFEKNLWGANEHRATPMLRYLFSRGVTEESIKKFRLGFAPDSWDALLTHLTRAGFKEYEIEKAGLIIKKDSAAGYYDRFRNRIMFPIMDANGRVIGFGGRIFSIQPEAGSEEREAAAAKYINSPETPIYNKSRVLYAFDKAKQAIREKNQCIAVEGYMDAVLAHQAGAENTVSISGTALTHDQLRMISRLTDTVVFSFDMDAAGQSATKRSLELAAEFNLQRKVLLLSSGKDPADAVRENPQMFLTAIAEARPLMEYYFEEAEKRHDIRSVQGKKNAGLFFLPHVRMLTNEIERSHWIQKFAELVSVPEFSVRQELEKIKRDALFHKKSENAPFAAEKKSRRELLERHALSLYLEQPETFRAVAKEFDEKIPFSVLSHGRLFEELCDKKTISPELMPLYDVLEFQRELFQFKTEKLDEEIRACAKSIFSEHYKERRAFIEQQIRHLEKTQNKDTIRGLLAEFHALSSKIARYSA